MTTSEWIRIKEIEKENIWKKKERTYVTRKKEWQRMGMEKVKNEGV